MPNYATTAELQTRFENSTEVAYMTDDAVTGVPDETVLTDCIEVAEGDINSRIGKRFATPVVVSGNTELTALLKRKTLDLAEYNLLRRQEIVSEIKERQAALVLEWADAVASGKYILSGAATPPSTTSRDPLAQWSDAGRETASDSNRIFSRDSMSRL